jgi:L-threonylcarbamoyladenylate synthase
MTKPVIISSVDYLDEAIKALRRGLIVAYPTETFYGLAVDPFNEDALRSLFHLKGRAFTEPVSVIIGDKSMLSSIVKEVTPLAERLIEEFWPGPLTLVFNASPDIPALLTGRVQAEQGPTIGVRVPGCETARRLSMEFGGPVTATSANPSGGKSPVKLSEVIDYFDGLLDIAIDGGTLTGALGSTVADVTGEKIGIIRAGEIENSRLEEI